MIARADLTAGNDLSLEIQGEATHNHMVQLSAAEVASIRGGGRVSKASSTTEAHQHTVTFN